MKTATYQKTMATDSGPIRIVVQFVRETEAVPVAQEPPMPVIDPSWGESYSLTPSVTYFTAPMTGFLHPPVA